MLLLLVAQPASGKVETLVKNADLQFGSFVSLGSSGTVMVTAGGLRSSTGGIGLLSRGTVAAASFTATGGKNSKYAIKLPANNTVVITHQGQTLTLTNFTCSVPLTGTLSGTSLTFTVGATATVGPAPTLGTYTGTFSVTAN